MNMFWFLRMARWARNPPGPRQVRLVLIVIAITLVVVGIEYFFGWPDSLSVEPRSRRILP